MAESVDKQKGNSIALKYKNKSRANWHVKSTESDKVL